MSEQEAKEASVPTIYASGFSVLATGTDMKIILTDNVPGELDDKGKVSNAQIMNGILTLSIHSAKDLAALVNDAIAHYEKEFGTVNTPFLKGMTTPNDKG